MIFIHNFGKSRFHSNIFHPRAKAHGNSMNGKLWKVYSKMGDAGSGYDYQNQNYEDIRLPVPMTFLFVLYLILKGFNLYSKGL